ncbi:hypothetical protein RitSun_91 [Mycobacterium phage RitSun]|nr:hypothetical protein RitSun_91 [Mycobacterium phage RitSun]
MNNPELRAVLTKALKAHQVYQCSRSGWDEESIQWWQCHGCDFKSNTFPIKGINRVVLGEAIAAEHVTDVIASLPGVAVIQLPEPSYVDEPEAGMKGVGFNGGPRDTHLSERGVYAHGGMVYDQWDGVTPADALKVAGWWAAAAAVAEGEDK